MTTGFAALRNQSASWSGRPDSILATSSLGSWHSATELRPPGAPYLTTIRAGLFPVLERHGVGLQHLVAPRLPVEALVHAVEVDLLVERHRRHLVDPELVDPVILLEALLLVHDRLRLVDHAVEVLVVPVHEDAGGLEERVVHGLGVHRSGPPADQPYSPRIVDVDHDV